MKENLVFLMAVIGIVFLFHFELPYVIYKPGGAIDLSDRVVVEEGFEASGSLSMAYVSMIRGNIPFLLFSYLMPNWDIVSTDELKPENETLDEMIRADQISLLSAQNNAIISAYSLASKEVKVKSSIHHIVYISENAHTDLQLFDELQKINGQEITSLDDVANIVSNYHEGDVLMLEVKHDGEVLAREATVYQSTDGLKIGISLTTTYELETDPNISISSKSSESGPSGGLMTSLAIYNGLVEEDITKGRTIIGTGTISSNGEVGEIGGVKYKVLGAIKKKADIFLVPEGNYQEAIEVKNKENSDIRIISVKSLKDAIEALS